MRIRKTTVTATVVVFAIVGLLYGFGVSSQAARAIQVQWREIRYAQVDKMPGSDFSWKNAYASESGAEQWLYRQLYMGACLHDDEVCVDGYDNETIWNVYQQLKYDCPELFALGSSPAITTTTQHLFIDCEYKHVKFKYNCNASQVEERKQQLTAAINEFESGSSWAQTDRKKAEAANNWVMSCVSYNEDASNYDNAYGALVEGQTACAGYAQAFTLLMRCSDVACDTIVGYADPGDGSYYGHAWNRVWLDGNWEYLDITWDDNSRNKSKYAFITEEAMATARHRAAESNILSDEQKDAVENAR